MVCQRWCVAPGATCTTPATQNEGRCRQVPRLPRETKVDVTRCHACDAKCRGAPATNGDQARHQVQLVPRLPRKTKVDVTKCHACHAKRRWMSPSATPATQSAAASPATKTGPSAPPSATCPTPATQNEGRCRQVPRLPRETKVDVTKCHACHAKCRSGPGDQRRPSVPPSATCAAPTRPNAGRCRQVPCLPRETKVDVTKCHACHAKCRGAPGDQRRPSAPPSPTCTTPATQNEGGCDQVPRLPRETKVDVTKCHACHAKCRGAQGDQRRPSAPPSATCTTPATQNEGRCRQVPRLPRETKVDVTKCHACHAKCRSAPGNQRRPSAPPSATCTTPATQNEGRCRQVPRLPRETKVDVTKCHACHAKCRSAPGNQRRPRATKSNLYHACHAKRR